MEGGKRGHSDEERRPSAEDKRGVDSFWKCSDRVQEVEQCTLSLVLPVCQQSEVLVSNTRESVFLTRCCSSCQGVGVSPLTRTCSGL